MATTDEEVSLLKFHTYYIVSAIGSGIRYENEKWEHGILYLTNKNLWFSVGDKHAYIPLTSIFSVDRSVDVWEPNLVRFKIMAVDYKKGNGMSGTALIAAEASAIEELKNRIAKLSGESPGAGIELTEVDNKLIALLYTGISDNEMIKFLLGLTVEDVEKHLSILDQKGYRKMGRLTLDGIKCAQEILKMKKGE